MPFTPNNSEQRSPPTCYRGCWHVVSRGLFLLYRPYLSHSLLTFIFQFKRTLQPSGLLHSRGVAPSDFRPLRNILSCCLPQEFGPYLSPNVSVHPLRPDTHHRLGMPLPLQLANGPQAPPEAKLPLLSLIIHKSFKRIRYYPLFLMAIPNFRIGRLRVTHQSATLGQEQALALPFDLHA